MPSLTSPISGTTMLTPAQREQLLRGDMYVNLHTVNHQEFGELRSQLLTPNMVVVDGRFSGAQQVPAVNTAATGIVSGGLRQRHQCAELHGFVPGLTPVAGSLPHRASRPGQPDSVTVLLQPLQSHCGQGYPHGGAA
jgi:hypothetical protein